MTKQPLSILYRIFGALGTIGCLVAIFKVWNTAGQVSGATEKIFVAVDKSLSVVRAGVAQSQERAATLKLGVEDIQQGVERIAKSEIRERLAESPAIQQKTEQLTLGLQKTDHWLELSQSSVQAVGRTLALVSSTGVGIDTDVPEHLLATLTKLREELAQSLETVEQVQTRLANEEETDESPIKQLLVRVAATVSSLDERLEELDKKLADVALGMQNSQAVALRRIRRYGLTLSFFLVWLAAGQVALCSIGWRGYTGSQEA